MISYHDTVSRYHIVIPYRDIVSRYRIAISYRDIISQYRIARPYHDPTAATTTTLPLCLIADDNKLTTFFQYINFRISILRQHKKEPMLTIMLTSSVVQQMCP